jgi:hypothetical protein
VLIELPSILADAAATGIAIPDKVFALIAGVPTRSFFGLVRLFRLCRHILAFEWDKNAPLDDAWILSSCHSADLPGGVIRSHLLINAVSDD